MVNIDDEESIKALTKQVLEDPAERERRAADRCIWVSVLDGLRARRAPRAPTSLVLLRLANNLSATSAAGSASAETQFATQLLAMDLNEQPPENRLRWQVLANLSFAPGMGFGTTEQLAEISGNPGVQHFAAGASDDPVRHAAAVAMFTRNLLRQEVGGDTTTPPSLPATFYPAVLEFVLPLDKSVSPAHPLSRAVTALVHTAFVRELTPGPPEFILKTYLPLLQRTCSQLIPVMRGSDSSGSSSSDDDAARLRRDNDEYVLSWAVCCSLLEAASRILPASGADVLAAFRTAFLPALLDFLLATQSLPMRSKLGDVVSSTNDGGSSNATTNDEDFPRLRTLSLMLLAVLVEGDLDAQNSVRESGGLAAVLGYCVLDGNNPFMKEAAVLCVRYLLAANAANQAFVASLEARKVVDAGVLEEAGWEVAVEGGKIVPKRPNSYSTPSVSEPEAKRRV